MEASTKVHGAASNGGGCCKGLGTTNPQEPCLGSEGPWDRFVPSWEAPAPCRAAAKQECPMRRMPHRATRHPNPLGAPCGSGAFGARLHQ
jgi:hypothetical protein